MPWLRDRVRHQSYVKVQDELSGRQEGQESKPLGSEREKARVIRSRTEAPSPPISSAPSRHIADSDRPGERHVMSLSSAIELGLPGQSNTGSVRVGLASSTSEEGLDEGGGRSSPASTRDGDDEVSITIDDIDNEKDDDDHEDKEGVFLVHVPRTGGTSLTRKAKVAQRARRGKSWWRRALLIYFQYRYWVYEHQAFPIFTLENLFALCMAGCGVAIYYKAPGGAALPFPYIMWSLALISVFFTSYVFTPMGLRVRGFAMFLCQIGEWFFNDKNLPYGMNKDGFLMHLTAEELVRHGYVDAKVLRERGFAISRNPYSRMVSVYLYNKQPGESFKHFVQEAYDNAQTFWLAGDRRTDEKLLYCHYLPQRAFTHHVTSRVVRDASGSRGSVTATASPMLRAVIPLESLKQLEASGWQSPEAQALPGFVRRALQGMPHRNKRKKKKAIQEWYDQDCMMMVAEMYAEDFRTFGYDISTLPGRSQPGDETSLSLPDGYAEELLAAVAGPDLQSPVHQQSGDGRHNLNRRNDQDKDEDEHREEEGETHHHISNCGHESLQRDLQQETHFISDENGAEQPMEQRSNPCPSCSDSSSSSNGVSNAENTSALETVERHDGSAPAPVAQPPSHEEEAVRTDNANMRSVIESK